jgi:hypothetical protein
VPRQNGQRANKTVSARERARSAYKDVRTTSMCMICRGKEPHPCWYFLIHALASRISGCCRDMNRSCFGTLA